MYPQSQPPNDTTSELEALHRAQQGDVAAFERLYRRHVGRVYAICLRLSGQQALAEELTQESFVRAWERLSSFDAGTQFAAWLARVAINTTLAELRSGRRRTAREETLHRDGDVLAFGRPAMAGLGPDLERAIGRLPLSARQVLLLHDVEGFQHEEIANLLGVTAGTSKGYLHRAREQLRKVLGS